jgi:hypothetical protein
MLYNVQDFGADPTGVTNSTAAINSALVAGSIFYPPGKYLITGPLNVPDNRFIKHLPGAILLVSVNRNYANATTMNAAFYQNSDTNTGSNIWIEGGIFDGNQAIQTPISYSGNNPFLGGIQFLWFNMTNLTIKDVEFRNQMNYATQLSEVSNFVVSGMRMNNSGSGLHQDGVHLNGPCGIGLIENIWRNSGNDDEIALNANDGGTGSVPIQGVIHDIVVRNVDCAGPGNPYSGSGVRILNSTYAISNIDISGIHGFYGCQGVISMLALEGTPSIGVSDLSIHDCSAFSADGTCGFITSTMWVNDIQLNNIQWTGNDGANIPPATYVAEFVSWYPSAGTTTNFSASHIVINDFGGTNISSAYNSVFHFQTAPITNLTISDITVSRKPTAATGHWLLETSVPILNATINGATLNGFFGPLQINSGGSVVNFQATGILPFYALPPVVVSGSNVDCSQSAIQQITVTGPQAFQLTKNTPGNTVLLRVLNNATGNTIVFGAQAGMTNYWVGGVINTTPLDNSRSDYTIVCYTNEFHISYAGYK